MGYIPIDKYVGYKDFIYLANINSKYIVRTSLHALRRGNKPKPFSISNDYFVYNLNIHLSRVGSNVTILSLSHNCSSNVTHITCLSNDCGCGKHWTVRWHSVRDMEKYKGCQYCRKNDKTRYQNAEISRKSKSNDCQFVKTKQKFDQLCKDNGFTLIGDYNGLSKKNELMDKKGYKYFAIIRDGKKYAPFSPSNKFALENMQRYLDLNGARHTVLSTEYESSTDVLTFKCKKHGEIINTPFNYIKYRITCCKKDENIIYASGRYSLPLAEENKSEWVRVSSIVYLIHITGNDENFCKIGMTKNSVKYRMRSLPTEYKYNTYKVFKTNMYYATYLERYLLDFHSPLKYEPKIWFGGHTECFSQMILDLIEYIERKGVDYIVDKMISSRQRSIV